MNEPSSAALQAASSGRGASRDIHVAGARADSPRLSAPLLTLAGEKVGVADLPEALFGGPVRKHLLWEVVRAEAANVRRGTHKTKGRGEISGGGKKPWKQKHTGRARAGSTRSPVWRGGGIVFGPKPRDYDVAVPKKVRQGALRSALAARAREERVIVVRETDLDRPRTAAVAKFLTAVPGLVGGSTRVPRRPLFILSGAEENLDRSVRNIRGARTDRWENLQTTRILASDLLVFTEKALSSCAAAKGQAKEAVS